MYKEYIEKETVIKKQVCYKSVCDFNLKIDLIVIDRSIERSKNKRKTNERRDVNASVDFFCFLKKKNFKPTFDSALF